MPIQHPVVKVAAVQAEPCWFNIDAGVEKTIKLITEYLLNAITLHGSELLAIREACQKQKIYINLSFAERVAQGSSMWMANVTIDDQGTIIGHRRKIKPTGIERMLFGDATGDTVNNVVQTPFGRVGNLQCWEHMQPLLKYHTYFQNEQIHCASWPCKFPYAGFEPWSFTREAGIATTQTYAMEGGTFAVMATNVMSEEGARLQGIDLARSYFSVPGGGCSAVFAPDGKMLTDLLEPGAEGIV
ncbi:unnamed protein product [Clonostachys solani]|uniref:nitrilase n=1 Tax=Clonostachys solani TaxID=160281 RepID=A0A9N9W2X0_9HYPO|nr:unnamed protein product [Clonostachys solani]